MTPPADSPPAAPAARAALLLLCAAFVVLSARTSWILPLFEVPDEFEHYEVVVHYARELALPDLTDMPPHALDEGVQPPLAYVGFALGLAALDLVDVDVFGRRLSSETRRREGDVALFLHGPDERRPYEGLAWRLHVLRLLNLLPGVATVLATFALARRVAPHRDGLACGAAALVALNPQFGSLCGGITNDPLSIALCTVALVGVVSWSRCPAPSDRRLLLLGASVGAALIAKLSATFLLPTIAVALLLRRARGEAAGRVAAQGYLIAVGVVLVSGPWFVWNAVTYGDPLAWELGVAKFGLERAELTEVPTWRLLARRYLPRMASSYAARFGAHGPGGAWLTGAWSAVAAAAAVGAVVLAVSRRARSAAVPPGQREHFALLAIAIAANVFASVTFYLSFNQAQGRYLFPTIAPSAVLVAVACAAWLRPAAAVLGLAALAAALAHAQTGVLTRAFWPLNRGHDDVFALGVPTDAEPPATTVAWISPARESTVSPTPPELRWETDSPHDRFTLRFASRGFTTSIDLWRDVGVTAHDRFEIPPEIWTRVPPGVELTMQARRLATSDERRAGVVPPATEVRTWRRSEGEPPDTRAREARATLLDPPATASRGVRLRVRDGDVVVDVEDGGPPRATLLCLHGEGDGLADWAALTRAERPRRRVVTVALDHGVAVDELARRIGLVVDALAINDAMLIADGRAADVAAAYARDLAEAVAVDRAARAPGAPAPAPLPVRELVLTRRPDRAVPPTIPVTVVPLPDDGRPIGERVRDALVGRPR